MACQWHARAAERSPPRRWANPPSPTKQNTIRFRMVFLLGTGLGNGRFEKSRKTHLSLFFWGKILYNRIRIMPFFGREEAER